MNIQKVVYYIATGVLTIIMIYSVQMYLRNPEAIAGYFESVNYPGYLVYQNIRTNCHLGEFLKMVEGVGLCRILF